MKESVTIAKEANSKKESSPTRSDKSIQRLRNAPERQLGSLRDVIGNIRRNGGTPSVESIATELSVMPSSDRASALLALQQTHGNQYVQRVVTGIQAKLKIGQPNDIYEQEADKVADVVMRMPEPEVQRQVEEEKEKKEEELIQTKPISEQITPLVQRQVEEEEEGELQAKELSGQTLSVTTNEELRRQLEEEEEEELQTKALPNQTSEVTSDLESRINAIGGGGQPLPASTRAFFEPRFGYDFSQVRAHTDAEADTLNRALNARAFTAGQDIFFRQGAYNLGSRQGRELLAHELTHVVQQNRQALKVQRFTEAICIQRDNEPSTITPAGEGDYRSFVEEVIRLFETSVEFYSLTPSPLGSRAGGGAAETLQQIGRILASWRTTYNNAHRIIADNLSGDADLGERLRHSYQAAVETLHRSTGDRPRVNVILIAAPPEAEDEFIASATDYASSYFMNPRGGDIVVVRENIASPSDLFDQVEAVHSERMIRRIDIFAHGTIDPTNQIRFGADWYTTQQIQDEANSRQYQSSYIQSVSRFDRSSLIEVHACRLGGGRGEEFLTGLGRSIGGTHGQEVVGYQQRWVPRRFEVTWRGIQVRNTQNDIYGPNALPDRNRQPRDHNRFIQAFEARAVRTFDGVAAGSMEVQRYLNDAERAGGEVTHQRKIEIMRAMYDENECWLIGYMYAGARPALQDPAAGVRSRRYTFTREEGDWSHRTLSVTIEPPFSWSQFEGTSDEMRRLIQAYHELPPTPIPATIAPRTGHDPHRPPIPLGELEIQMPGWRSSPVSEASTHTVQPQMMPSEREPAIQMKPTPDEGSANSSPIQKASAQQVGNRKQRLEDEVPESVEQAVWRVGAPPVEISSLVSLLDMNTRSRIEAIRGNGNEIPLPLRRTAENNQGVNLSDVQIHTGGQADQLTKDLNAEGFTIGRDVFLTSEAAQKPEIVAHEFQHAAENDQFKLHFWTTDQERTVYIRRLRSVLTGPPPQRYDQTNGPNNILNELYDRTVPPISESSNNQHQLTLFFQEYGGVQVFVRDWATCLRRMADAQRFQLQPPERTRDPHEQRMTALAWYRRFINMRIDRVYAIDEQVRLLGDQIIYPLQERQQVQQQRTAPQRQARESNWRTQMQSYFRRNPSSQISRLSLWIIGNWISLFNAQDPLGNAANSLGWGVMETTTRETSVLALSRPLEQERSTGMDLGRNYFLEIHQNYAGAFQRLFTEAMALQQSLYGGRSRDQPAYEFLHNNRPHWQTVRNSLTYSNWLRLNGLQFCWDGHWNQPSSRAAPSDHACLRTAGISIASGGGWQHTAVNIEQ